VYLIHTNVVFLDILVFQFGCVISFEHICIIVF